jgi:hypothetical protein
MERGAESYQSVSGAKMAIRERVDGHFSTGFVSLFCRKLDSLLKIGYSLMEQPASPTIGF